MPVSDAGAFCSDTAGGGRACPAAAWRSGPPSGGGCTPQRRGGSNPCSAARPAPSRSTCQTANWNAKNEYSVGAIQICVLYLSQRVTKQARP